MHDDYAAEITRIILDALEEQEVPFDIAFVSLMDSLISVVKYADVPRSIFMRACQEAFDFSTPMNE